MSALRLGVVVAMTLSAIAPVQCSRRPDPDERHEDSPGDALWGLASEFAAQNNDAARSQTLRYLVARYPSNRHSHEARAELESSKAKAAPDGG